MNKKIMLIFLLGMFLFSLASISALDSLGTFKQNQEVRVTQTCSDATYINLSSVSYPNSSSAVSNIQMTSSGSGEFYYVFNKTSDLGRYDFRGVSDGCTKTFASYFIVSNDGNIYETQYSIFFIFILLIFFGLMIVSIKLLKKKEEVTGKDLYQLKNMNKLKYFWTIGIKKNLWIVGCFGIYLSLFMFLALINVFVYMLNLTEIQEITQILVILVSWGFIPFILFWIVWLLIYFWNNFNDMLQYQYGGMK